MKIMISLIIWIFIIIEYPHIIFYEYSSEINCHAWSSNKWKKSCLVRWFIPLPKSLYKPLMKNYFKNKFFPFL
jgi:hypothetical protein